MPDLYTVFEGTDRDLSIEETFAQWEKPRFFVRVRKKIERQAPLEEDDIANLYVFAGALMVRPPHYIEHFASQWRNIASNARSIKINPNAKPLPSLSKGDDLSLSIGQVKQFADNPMGTLCVPKTLSGLMMT